ncbi:MAG: TMEM165/GDT1 family protein [Lachnospiraceae bacterium]|nr:TMEM165/GDT1 family protein [Lachnospiraceae bacterium]
MLLFFKIMFTVFIAEMGDKTQLMLVALTSKYKLKDILAGTALAILVLNGIAVLAGGLISGYIPLWLIRLIAAAAFLFFAFTSLDFDDEEEEETKKSKISFAFLAVFSTFFVAELGDKTQLTAITFGANEGLQSALVVWLACSVGLFSADVLGIIICLLLKGKTPAHLLNIAAFFIFMIFGILTLHEGLELFPAKDHAFVFPLTAGIAVLFFLLSTIRFIRNIKNMPT